MRKTGRKLCEPRALWSVVEMPANALQGAQGSDPAPAGATLLEPGHWLLDPKRFRNGSDYTFVLTHILYAGINYILREPENGVAGQMHNGTAWINRANILVSSPMRAYFGRKEHQIIAYAPEPSEAPDSRYAAANPYISSLLGINRWDFDFEDGPFLLPQSSRVEMALTGITHPPGDSLTAPETSFMFFEEYDDGGWARGNARLHERAAHPFAQVITADPTFPGSIKPFADDAFGSQAAGSVTTAAMYPEQQQFTADDFREQEANRGAKTSRLAGFATAIDQVDYDEEIQASAVPGMRRNPISPISLRAGVRAASVGGGSGRRWWRDGAPLALVSPTVTPAAVQRFDRPVVLAKGDGLNIEVQVPAGTVVGQGNEEPNYNFGVALCGYAIIEG